MPNSKPQKLYVIRKYVLASSIQDAVRKEKCSQVDDIWLDDDFKRMVVSRFTNK